MPTSALILLTLSAFLAASGQLLFKFGATGKNEFYEYFNFWIVTGLIAYGLSTAIWIYMLSSQKLVNVYAFTALTFVLVYVSGVFILGEKISVLAAVGVGLVLAGLFLITRYAN